MPLMPVMPLMPKMPQVPLMPLNAILPVVAAAGRERDEEEDREEPADQEEPEEQPPRGPRRKRVKLAGQSQKLQQAVLQVQAGPAEPGIRGGPPKMPDSGGSLIGHSPPCSLSWEGCGRHSPLTVQGLDVQHIPESFGCPTI